MLLEMRHAICILIGALLAGPVIASPAEDRPPAPRPSLRSSVRFVTPSAGQVMYGLTRIRVGVSPPPGAIVRSVEFIIDGEKAGSDRVPPYDVIWNAGQGMGSHTITARALFSDGTSAEDAITTRGLSMTDYALVEGSLLERVSLLVSVVDKLGMPVEGLKQEDFRVKERGEVMEIKSFDSVRNSRHLPLSLTVLVDQSGSMRISEEEWREASVELLSALRPIDQVRVSAFAEQTAVLQDFTKDAVALAESVRGVGPPMGRTHLYASLYETVRDMRDFPGRKAVFVITDGLDTQFQGGSGLAGSRGTALVGAVERLAVRSGVTLVTILTQPTSVGLLPVQALAMKTGGWWTYPSSDPATLMRRLSERLLGAYVIEYEVSHDKRPDQKRGVSVSLTREETGWDVFTATGVFGRLTPEEALEDDVKAGSAPQRRRAILEIQRLGIDRATPLLLDALGDPSPEVQAAALFALGERREAGTLGKIARRIHDEDPRVREAAFRALVRFGSDAIAVISGVARRRGREQAPSLRTLGLIGDPTVLPILEEALRDEDCAVREAAADGAGFLFELTGGGLLAEDSTSESSGAGALDLLRGALADPCPDAADAAALALGRLAHPDALPRLISVAAGAAQTGERGESLLILASYLSPEVFHALEHRLVSGPAISPEARTTAAALYAAAIRTARWLATEDGLAKISDLGINEARAVLLELQAFAGVIQADPAWREPIDRLLLELDEREVQSGPAVPAGPD